MKKVVTIYGRQSVTIYQTGLYLNEIRALVSGETRFDSSSRELNSSLNFEHKGNFVPIWIKVGLCPSNS